MNEKMTLPNNMVDMQSRKVVFGTNFVQISKIDRDSIGALLFIDSDDVRYPFREGYGVNKPRFEKFIYFSFNSCVLPWMDLP